MLSRTLSVARAIAPLGLAFAVLAGSSMASAAVIYTFRGTPDPQGPFSGSGPHEFVYTARGFLGAWTSIPSEQFDLCEPCGYQPGFFPSPDARYKEDTIRFSAPNVAHFYNFPFHAFTTPGQHSTLPGRLNVGTLTVEVTDELAVANAAGFDLCGPNDTRLCSSFTISPGEIASVFGSDSIARTTQSASGTTLPYVLAGASVTIVDSDQVSWPAPLYFVSPRQINFVVPPESALGDATLIVETPTGTRVIATTLTATRPGIFAANANGQGVPAAQVIRVRADGSQIVEDVFQWDEVGQRWAPKPFSVGADTVYLLLYGTGIRNGSETRASCWCEGPDPIDFPVTYAGPQPEYPGLDQVNIRLRPIHDDFPVAGVDFPALIWLTVEGKTSNSVGLLFQ